MNVHPFLQKSTVFIILNLEIVIYVATVNDAPLHH